MGWVSRSGGSDPAAVRRIDEYADCRTSPRGVKSLVRQAVSRTSPGGRKSMLDAPGSQNVSAGAGRSIVVRVHGRREQGAAGWRRQDHPAQFGVTSNLQYGRPRPCQAGWGRTDLPIGRCGPARPHRSGCERGLSRGVAALRLAATASRQLFFQLVRQFSVGSSVSRATEHAGGSTGRSVGVVRSVEMLSVNDIDEFLTVDPPAQIVREQLHDASVLMRAQCCSVRGDHHLRHLPQRGIAG